MASNEDYLDALTEYSKTPSRKIPPVLEQYLNGVAKNGETLFQWQLLKPLIVGKMDQVVGELQQRLSSENIPDRPNVENVRFDVMRARIMDALNKFNGAPFTIQRLCELLVNPSQHYKRSDKFMRGLEKNVLIVSTVDPYGRKVVSESGNKHRVNGVDTNGSPFFPRDSNITSNLPPVPGWITTTVTTTTRPQNIDSTEPKSTFQQKLSGDSVAAASGVVSGDLVSSTFADQGEQSPAVHAEEVVEETVVTMDTNEASSVATDGGEAMAEEEDEEVMEDDTNASSSSSSSSEELSTADTSDSSGTEMSTTVTSSNKIQARPWAVITNEGSSLRETASAIVDSCSNKSLRESASSIVDSCSSKSLRETLSSNVGSYTSNTTDSSSEKLSEVAISHVSLDKKTDSPSSSEAKSSHKEHSAGADLVDSFAECSSELSSGTSIQQKSLNSTVSNEKQITTPDDSENHASESNNSCVVASDMKSESSATGTDDLLSSSTASSISHQSLHELPLSMICSNTGVIASSTTDSVSSKINSVVECDSVAVLERLVDSVEQPQSSQVSFSFSLPISAIPINNTERPESSPLSYSFNCLDSEEPLAKHSKLSDDASCSTVNVTMSSTVLSASDVEALSSNCTSAGSDAMTGTTSDTTPTIAAASSRVQSSEIPYSLDTVPCSLKDSDISTDVGEDCIPENVTSQLLSSGDSQGFDVYGDTLYKNGSEEKLSEEAQSQEATELNTLIPKNEQEPMDQE